MTLAPIFPTDSARDAPDCGVGVDTIAVIGPTSSSLLMELEQQRIERQIDRRTGEVIDREVGSAHSRRIGLAWCRMYGLRQDGDDAQLRLELSLPTMLAGHNRNPLSSDWLADAVDAALSDVAFDFPDVPTLEQVRVARLDLARDFHGVPSPADVLTSLTGYPIPRATVHRHEYRPTGELQTVTRGSSSAWLVRGYDKAEEMLAHARKDHERRELLRAWAAVSEGQLRFELQVRTPVLRENGLLSGVERLTPSRLYALANDYFCRARWHLPMSRSSELEVMNEIHGQVSRADYRNLLAFLQAKRLGAPSPLTRHPYERARALARRYGLPRPGRLGDTEYSVLDFERGIITHPPG